MVLPALLSCLVALSPVGAEPAVEATTPSHHLEGVPLINYSSDTGLGLGLYGAVERFAASHTPYQLRLEVQAYASTGGTQFHFAQVDLPQVGGSAWRIDALAGYRSNSSQPWFGLGNHAPPDATRPDSFYRYNLVEPVLRLRARRKVLGPLSVVASYRLFLTSVQAAPGSLLAREAPLGMQGGRFGELAVGLVFDTRDQETSPNNGVVLEASGRTAQAFLGSQYATAGVFAAASGYREVVRGLVVAGRLAFDDQWGAVPFDRLGDLGTTTRPAFLVDGIGGQFSVRGLYEAEYVGPTKALANLELRERFLECVLFQQALALTAVGFVDAGRVWSPGDPTSLPAAGLHAGVGGGLRVAWGEFFIVRADVGYAEGRARIYADFGQVF